MTNPLGNLISRGEGQYNSYNRGTSNGRILGANQSIDFSRMELGELLRRQALPIEDDDRVFAVGKYQIIPSTMNEAVAGLDLEPNENYTSGMQERIFAEYLIREKRPEIYGYITGQAGVSLHSAQKAVCKEWASVADPDTGQVYAPYARHGNRASIEASEVSDALGAMRDTYRASIESGRDSKEAWLTATGQSDGLSPSLQPGPITRGAIAPTLLHQGVSGKDALSLQRSLNVLGNRDAHDHVVSEDGDFGPRTREAVEAFQRENGLSVDGIAGPKTLGLINERLLARQEFAEPKCAEAFIKSTLADPGNAGHALYKQAFDQIQAQGPRHFGLANDSEVRNAAGTLAFEAKVSGLQRIDHVIANKDTSGLVAVQGALSDPAQNRIYVDRAQAAAHPLERSSEQLQQESDRQAQQQPQTQEQSQQLERVRTALMH